LSYGYAINAYNYTYVAIGIKMIYRDLPYYEGIRAKTRREYKLHEISTKITQTLYIPLEMVFNFVPVCPIQSFKTLADLPFNGEYSHIQLT